LQATLAGKAALAHNPSMATATADSDARTDAGPIQAGLPLATDANGQPGKNGAAFKDPAFTDNKVLPVHRWVPWIAGFSAAFVDEVLDTHLPAQTRRQQPLVLDPFAGVGTTLVQAAWRGCNCIGFELNPYAALAARVKLAAPQLNVDSLDRAIAQVQKAACRWRTAPPDGHWRPPGFRSRLPFFSPRVERQVLHLLAFIAKLAQPEIADVFRVAFGSVMVSFSNYTYEPSLGSRPGAGKPLVEDAEVSQHLLAKLQQMRADAQWVQAQTNGGRHAGKWEVYNADFFTGQARLAPASVHLALTSPPYLNNYHYVRSTRPQMHWLSLLNGPAEQRALEERNFGKFWQTVRQGEAVPLAFRHAKLEQLLGQLRRVRASAGAYGGPGWANYAATYFNDCDRLMAALYRLLAPGGVAVVVIGNSIIQGLEFKTDQILGEIAARRGLALAAIQCLRQKRVGASITQSAVRRGQINRSTLSESAVILRQW
jgi:DNA modification methylase